MPMVPPAPVRFSMTTCWPIARDTGSPTTRATKSRPPPGASGTMKRTGRLGHAASDVPCARAGFGPCGAWAIPPSSAMPPAAARLMNVRRSMLGNLSSPSLFESILHFDVGLRNDLAEFLGLRCNERAVLRRRQDARHDALHLQLPGDRLVAQARRHDLIEARDDRLRHGGGREQSEPIEQLVAASASGAA